MNSFFKINSWSLRKKLVTLSGISSLTILITVSFFFYPILHKAKKTEDIQYHQLTKTLGTEKCDKEITIECFKEIIIILLLGSVTSTLLSFILVSRILNKITNFSNALEKITATSLHKRITLSDWPYELVGLGDKFNKMLDRLECYLNKQSQFSSDIAHELKTPINNLRTLTELTLLKPHDIAEYQQVLASNLEEYDLLSSLIDKLLFLAKFDHNQICIRRERKNLKQEITKIIDYYQAVLDEKKISISCNGDAEAAIDPTLFNRAMSNLISNSINYTPSTGKIMIQIDETHQDISIAIQDTGIGISNEHLPNIFDRFYRVDTARATNSGGVGLGLTIVKSIVALHHGNININSATGVGTYIQLTLPVFHPA